MWRFRTTEVAGDGYNDQALVFHVNGSDTLVTVNSTGNTGGQYDSGWHRFSWVSTVATTGGLFAVSLFNEGDNLVNSQLLLDAVPLPVAPLLFGSALLGFAALRKKLIAKPADLATA